VTEGVIHNRATIIQQKTERPMQFERMTKAHNILLTWLERRGRSMDDYIFQAASTIWLPEYAPICRSARRTDERRGLDVCWCGTHSMHYTKASLIYKATVNLRAIQMRLRHSNIENTLRKHMNDRNWLTVCRS
jgi:site-specific recombinase XerC